MGLGSQTYPQLQDLESGIQLHQASVSPSVEWKGQHLLKAHGEGGGCEKEIRVGPGAGQALPVGEGLLDQNPLCPSCGGLGVTAHVQGAVPSAVK